MIRIAEELGGDHAPGHYDFRSDRAIAEEVLKQVGAAGGGALDPTPTAPSWWISRRPSERCRRTDGRRGCAKRRWPPAPPNPTKRLRNARPMPPSGSRPPMRQRRASRRTSPASPTAPRAKPAGAPRQRRPRHPGADLAAAAPWGSWPVGRSRSRFVAGAGPPSRRPATRRRASPSRTASHAGRGHDLRLHTRRGGRGLVLPTLPRGVTAEALRPGRPAAALPVWTRTSSHGRRDRGCSFRGRSESPALASEGAPARNEKSLGRLAGVVALAASGRSPCSSNRVQPGCRDDPTDRRRAFEIGRYLGRLWHVPGPTGQGRTASAQSRDPPKNPGDGL